MRPLQSLSSPSHISSSSWSTLHHKHLIDLHPCSRHSHRLKPLHTSSGTLPQPPQALATPSSISPLQSLSIKSHTSTGTSPQYPQAFVTPSSISSSQSLSLPSQISSTHSVLQSVYCICPLLQSLSLMPGNPSSVVQGIFASRTS